ncbi:MAG: hypothetical protein JOZ94_19745 [Xanthobacteraceae bacterium]|nr:hypothetical protein [Xanthobacteraceae bacterium]MBV9627567.1 hypothetical protein [Xanthobacteraceae bacterium]
MTAEPKSRLDKTPAAALDYEIVQEKAAALGRLGRQLERALGALARFDQDGVEDSDARLRERRALVADAGEALWYFMVQREACGLRDSRQVMRDYGVPAEVQYRMGISTRR